jgi:hypothetical protein
MPKFKVPIILRYKNIFIVEADSREQAMNKVYDTDFEQLEQDSEDYLDEEVEYEAIEEVK